MGGFYRSLSYSHPWPEGLAKFILVRPRGTLSSRLWTKRSVEVFARRKVLVHQRPRRYPSSRDVDPLLSNSELRAWVRPKKRGFFHNKGHEEVLYEILDRNEIYLLFSRHWLKVISRRRGKAQEPYFDKGFEETENSGVSEHSTTGAHPFGPMLLWLPLYV